MPRQHINFRRTRPADGLVRDLAICCSSLVVYVLKLKPVFAQPYTQRLFRTAILWYADLGSRTMTAS